MQRRASLFSWIFALLFLGVTSCSVESAKPEKNQSLVIASDFLTSEDTLIFKKFMLENDLHIKIRKLSTEEIIREVKSKGFNCGIDMVFSKNMQTPIELNKKRILQDLIEEKNEIKSQNQYISYKYNFVGVGLDPFVFKFTNDSIAKPQTYLDLSKYKHSHTLSRSYLLSFLSPIREQRSRLTMYEWAKKWNAHTSFRSETNPKDDSSNVVLCKYSQLESFEDSVWLNYPEGHFFPNQNSYGVHFDLLTIAIIDQAEHYADAQKLLAYCQNPGFNTYLAKKFKHFPIYDYLSVRQNGPKFYSVSIDRLVRYHDVLNRMLYKLE